MSVLIHDSAVSGHKGWLLDALAARHAEGAVISPFATPWVSSQANPSAQDLVTEIRRRHSNAPILVDATTHGALLPGTDRLVHYATWSLWPVQQSLADANDIDQHVQAVFAAQTALGVNLLAPTVAVDLPGSPDATTALRVSRHAKRLQSTTMLSIAGRTSFWAAGAALDAYIGQHARLRPTGWYLVHIHDRSAYPADLTNTDAVAGWLRTIHSLSLRAPVTAAATDYIGIAATAAGANSIGTGWHTSQRGHSVDDWKIREPGGQYVPYSPHPALLARIKRDDALTLKARTPAFADSMRWDRPIAVNVEAERRQHLRWIHEHHTAILAAGPRPADRVPIARHALNGADIAWDFAIGRNSPGFTPAEKSKTVTGLRDGFKRYARNEGL